MGDRIFNMSQGSTYIENQTNYIRGNQVFSDPKFMSPGSDEPELKAPQTPMELLVRNHPDPVAFIAQLKQNIAQTEKPCDKMAFVLSAIESGYLPTDLQFPLFAKEIPSISQQVFSYWMTKKISDR